MRVSRKLTVLSLVAVMAVAAPPLHAETATGNPDEWDMLCSLFRDLWDDMVCEWHGEYCGPTRAVMIR